MKKQKSAINKKKKSLKLDPLNGKKTRKSVTKFRGFDGEEDDFFFDGDEGKL